MNVGIPILILSQTLQVETPPPIAVHLITPSASAPAERTQILGTLIADLRAETNLAPEPLDEAVFAGCQGSMACLAGRTRDRVQARHLLVVSVIGENTVRWASALLLDIDAALDCKIDDSSTADLCADRVAIIEVARTEIRDRAAVDAFLARLVTVELRPVFEASGSWRATSAIELVVDQPGVVTVDGRDVGRAEPGSVRLSSVPIGRHRLEVLFETGESSAEIDVRHGDIARLELAAPPRGRPVLRTALFWTGVATAGVGAVLTVWAIAFTATRGDDLCYPEERCTRSLATFERMIGNAEAGDTSGVLALPLGYSVLGAGGAWALGAALFDSDVPWIEALIGLAVGGAAYGFSVLIDDKT